MSRNNKNGRGQKKAREGKEQPLHLQDDLRHDSSDDERHFLEELPSDLDYKDQGLTLQELRRGERVATRGQNDDVPSNIDYKDQILSLEALRRGERVGRHYGHASAGHGDETKEDESSAEHSPNFYFKEKWLSRRVGPHLRRDETLQVERPDDQFPERDRLPPGPNPYFPADWPDAPLPIHDDLRTNNDDNVMEPEAITVYDQNVTPIAFATPVDASTLGILYHPGGEPLTQRGLVTGDEENTTVEENAPDDDDAWSELKRKKCRIRAGLLLLLFVVAGSILGVWIYRGSAGTNPRVVPPPNLPTPGPVLTTQPSPTTEGSTPEITPVPIQFPTASPTFGNTTALSSSTAAPYVTLSPATNETSREPTPGPTPLPTWRPTSTPTIQPSEVHTGSPSGGPTVTLSPTSRPTLTIAPTITFAPTETCIIPPVGFEPPPPPPLPPPPPNCTHPLNYVLFFVFGANCGDGCDESAYYCQDLNGGPGGVPFDELFVRAAGIGEATNLLFNGTIDDDFGFIDLYREGGLPDIINVEIFQAESGTMLQVLHVPLDCSLLGGRVCFRDFGSLTMAAFGNEQQGNYLPCSDPGHTLDPVVFTFSLNLPDGVDAITIFRADMYSNSTWPEITDFGLAGHRIEDGYVFEAEIESDFYYAPGVSTFVGGVFFAGTTDLGKPCSGISTIQYDLPQREFVPVTCPPVVSPVNTPNGR